MRMLGLAGGRSPALEQEWQQSTHMTTVTEHTHDDCDRAHT